MRSNSGNAFFITLVSVVLLGALTIVVARQMGGGNAQGISSEKATLYANEVINQATVAANVVQQMLETGTTVETLDYWTKPGDPSFNTGNNLVKLYHPAGGGWNVPQPIPAEMGGSLLNTTKVGIDAVEWTPSTASDVVFALFDVREEVCAAINKRLTGSETIPDWNGDFEDLGGMGEALTTALCPGCADKPMLCVRNVEYDYYGFYAVLYGR